MLDVGEIATVSVPNSGLKGTGLCPLNLGLMLFIIIKKKHLLNSFFLSD